MRAEWVFGWWNLIYLLPLGLAVVYLGVYALSGWTFGEADHEVAHDTDHAAGDAAHDHPQGHSAHGLGFGGGRDRDGDGGPLSWLGVGRVPLSLLLSILLLSFGTIGFIANNVAADWISPVVLPLISLPLAIAGAATTTRFVSRILHRIMPMNETYALRRTDLLGLSGQALYAIDESFGLAAVRDKQGNLLHVPCRIDPGRIVIEKGTFVMLVGYDTARQVYTVIPDVSSSIPAFPGSQGG